MNIFISLDNLTRKFKIKLTHNHIGICNKSLHMKKDSELFNYPVRLKTRFDNLYFLRYFSLCILIFLWEIYFSINNSLGLGKN